MNKLKLYDFVKFTYRGKEREGMIVNLKQKTAVVLIKKENKKRSFPLEQLEYVPPFVIEPDFIRKLCRYELKGHGFKKLILGKDNIIYEPCYTLTFEDLLIAFQNIRQSGNSKDTVRKEWFEPVYDLFISKKNGVFENTPQDVEIYEYLPNRRRYLYVIFCKYLYSAFNGLDDSLEIDKNSISDTISKIEKYIHQILADEKKPAIERTYTDDEMENFLEQYDNGDRIDTACKEEICIYKKFVEELCPKDNITALRCKAYSCYGGNAAFDCDWNTARECLLRLLVLTGSPEYANALGYIYYYGRCWNGQPQYEEAFKYFSIGAAGGMYESRYKLADMFENGYAVPKSTYISVKIIDELYEENIDYIYKGQFNCKFADIALRKGCYAEKEYYDTDYPEEDAYEYYLQADFAIRQKLKYHYYGDKTVAKKIREHLNNLLESGLVDKPVKSTYVNPSSFLSNYLKKYRRLRMRIKPLKHNRLKLMIRIAPFKDETKPPKLFITDRETGFCGMLETLVLTVNQSKADLPNGTDNIVFDDIIGNYNSKDKCFEYNFCLGTETIVRIQGTFVFSNPIKTSPKLYRFASVYFYPGCAYYDYLLDYDNAAVGDKAIVMTDRGETEVTIASIHEKMESELPLPLIRYKKILKLKNK